MQPVSFKGFAGVELKGDAFGSPDDPAVLLIHGGAQTRGVWDEVADALEKAGRYVIRIDLRGHGESEWPADRRYEFNAFVEDLRALLAQMASRPVIVAASLGGWAATAALGEDGGHLAAGLVLIDSVPEMDFDAACRPGSNGTDSASFDPEFTRGFDPEAAVARVTDAVAYIKLPVLLCRGTQSELSGRMRPAAFWAISRMSNTPKSGRLARWSPRSGRICSAPRFWIFLNAGCRALRRSIARDLTRERSGMHSAVSRLV
jgi:pimeloyl-ACP methyl ester carboxylesterase